MYCQNVYCIYLGISAMMSTKISIFEQSRFVSFPTSDVQIDGDKRHRGVVLGILASSWTSGNRCGIGKKRHPLIMNCHKLASFLPSSACRGKLLSCPVMAGCGERYEKVCILLLTLTGNTFSCLPRKAFYEMDDLR